MNHSQNQSPAYFQCLLFGEQGEQAPLQEIISRDALDCCSSPQLGCSAGVLLGVSEGSASSRALTALVRVASPAPCRLGSTAPTALTMESCQASQLRVIRGWDNSLWSWGSAGGHQGLSHTLHAQLSTRNGTSQLLVLGVLVSPCHSLTWECSDLALIEFL